MTNTRPKLTTAAQRMGDIFFMMEALNSERPGKGLHTKMDHTPWAVLNEFDLAAATLKWNCAHKHTPNLPFSSPCPSRVIDASGVAACSREASEIEERKEVAKLNV